MPIRRPLVIIDGQLQELPLGDVLPYYVEDAPLDGKTYLRRNGEWVEYTGQNYDFSTNSKYFYESTVFPFSGGFSEAVIQNNENDSTFLENFIYTMPDIAIQTNEFGLLVWSPHNLLANPLSPANQSVSIESGVKYTLGCDNGSVSLSNASSLTAITGSDATFTASSNTLVVTVSGSPTAIWLYRSDLGGMSKVPVNDRVNDLPYCLPYQGKAPRCNHYIYENEQSFENAGLLHSSDSVTNLITDALDPYTSWVAFSGLSKSQNAAKSRTGNQDATVLTRSAGTQQPRIYKSMYVPAGVHTFSVDVNHNNNRYIQLLFNTNISDEYANFDLETSSVSGTYINAWSEKVGYDKTRLHITFTSKGSTSLVFLMMANSLSTARNGANAGTTGATVEFSLPQITAGDVVHPFTVGTVAGQSISLLNSSVGSFLDFTMRLEGKLSLKDFSFYEFGVSPNLASADFNALTSQGNVTFSQSNASNSSNFTTSNEAIVNYLDFNLSVTHTPNYLLSNFNGQAYSSLVDDSYSDLSSENLTMFDGFVGIISKILFTPSDVGSDVRALSSLTAPRVRHAIPIMFQSNGIGWNDGNNSPRYPNNVYQFGQDNVVKAAYPEVEHSQDRDSNYAGQFTSFFSIYYLSENPLVDIEFIGCCLGGSGFDNSNWNPGDTTYENALSRINTTMINQPDMIMPMVLLQGGEADALTQTGIDNFASSFVTMRNDMIQRMEGFSNDTYMLIGAPGDGSPIPGRDALYDQMRTVIKNMVPTIPNAGYADPVGLNMWDGVHFDADAQDVLGKERYSAALLEAKA